MSDDDTRELPPVAAAQQDPREAAEEVAAAQGAGAATGTTEEDETVRIERAAPEPSKADAYGAGHIRVMAPAAPMAPAPEPARTLRVGTVVWGLVVAAVGVGLLSVSWGAHLDTELAFIVLLGAAGVALLVGSLVGMRRSRHRLEGRG